MLHQEVSQDGFFFNKLAGIKLKFTLEQKADQIEDKEKASGKYIIKSFNITMTDFKEEDGETAIEKFRKKVTTYLSSCDDSNKDELLPPEMHSQIATVDIVIGKWANKLNWENCDKLIKYLK